jgi:hypothetical protein
MNICWSWKPVRIYVLGKPLCGNHHGPPDLRVLQKTTIVVFPLDLNVLFCTTQGGYFRFWQRLPWSFGTRTCRSTPASRRFPLFCVHGLSLWPTSHSTCNRWIWQGADGDLARYHDHLCPVAQNRAFPQRWRVSHEARPLPLGRCRIALLDHGAHHRTRTFLTLHRAVASCKTSDAICLMTDVRLQPSVSPHGWHASGRKKRL